MVDSSHVTDYRKNHLTSVLMFLFSCLSRFSLGALFH